MDEIHIENMNTKSVFDYIAYDENVQIDLRWYERTCSEAMWTVVILKKKHTTSEKLSVYINENGESEFMSAFVRSRKLQDLC